MSSLTADAQSTTTDAVDFTRHNHGGIVSHVDGSVVWVSQKNPLAAGRFSCGPFPLLPTINPNGKIQTDVPLIFANYPTSTDLIPSKQFEIAGPYG